MEELKQFINKRGGIKRQISSLKKFIEEFKADENPKKGLYLLNSKYPAIDTYIKNYDEIYDQLIDKSSKMEDITILEKIEDDKILFHDNVLEIKYAFELNMEQLSLQSKSIDGNANGQSPGTPSDLLPSTNTDDIQYVETKESEKQKGINNTTTANKVNEFLMKTETQDVKPQVSYNSIKLPQISLPMFDGDLSKWLGFRDSFRDLILENPNITDIQRYYYLDGVLTGDARRAIANIEFSSDGFELAWNALNAKYNDVKAILENNLRNFFNMKAMTRESKTELSRLIDDSQKHLRALSKLGENLSDAVIIYIVKQRFDIETRKLWENEDTSDTFPSWKQMLEFLHRRCRALSSQSEPIIKSTGTFSNRRKQSCFTSTDDCKGTVSCPLCQKSHNLTTCNQFLSIPPEKRYEKTKSLRICTNCLKNKHLVFHCRYPRCEKCNRKHHVLLHIPQREVQKPNQDFEKVQAIDKSTSSMKETTLNMFCNKSETQSQVILSTAQIQIMDSAGKFHSCRALLDSASQSNFITSDLVNQLSINGQDVDLRITGLQHSNTDINQKIQTTIKSRFKPFSMNLDFYVVSQISKQLPNHFIDYKRWNLPPYLHLADKRFNIPGTIDILLGADIFFKILLNGHIEFDNNLPVLRETVFGWVVAGRLEQPLQNFHLSISEGDPNESSKLEELIQRFWTIESCDTMPSLSMEEKECEKIFDETYTRNESGRFVVKLPLKHNHKNLGDSKSMALRRFHHLEKKLQNHPELKTDYVNFMREYENLGHMRLSDASSSNQPTTISDYFLPHHAVLKPSSTSTKLRVVFDASAKTSSNLSLNNVLMVGPTVQSDLFSIVLRFRQHKYVFTADIEKMYRQIVVHKDHTPLQKIIWRENIDQPIREYELLTVTYGTSCAPYLATKSLMQLAKEEQNNYPYAAKVTMDSFYVDDLLTGCNTIENAHQIQSELIAMFNGAGMKLRKWTSNDADVISSIPMIDREKLDAENETIKTLGISWNSITDSFNFNTPEVNQSSLTTKRVLLSQIARLFDPLGLISPIIVVAKIMMQRVWIAKIGWDDPIPPDLQSTWNSFCEQLPSINSLQIPRLVIPYTASVKVHGFADASNLAYGACVYIQSTDSIGNSDINLLCSKSRVAPLSTTTIPRLELNAALLLAKLTQKVITALNIKAFNCVLWSDSSIVIAWLRLPPYQLKLYVANRVSQIQEITSKMQWRHVDSKNNAADILSRGALPNALSDYPEWFKGPEFLLKPEHEWPNKFIPPSTVPEMKECSSTFLIVKKPKTYINVVKYHHHSNFMRLIRVIAWCRRFFYFITSKDKSSLQPSKVLEPVEIAEATECLIRIVQSEVFSKELEVFKSGAQLDPKNSHARLNPFLDADGIIRVGGRLDQSTQLSFDQKHQILLADHHITLILIRRTHVTNLHAGVQQTLSILRQSYWIVNGKRLVKSVLNGCLPCYKIKPKTMTQLMGSLPESRIHSCRPFYVTGLDFCGPFSVRYKNQRKETSAKVYICIFVCFTTKAVHLEVVEDATSEAFIGCLKRFTSRRGRPVTIWSDNGSNFIGAHNTLVHLKELFDKESQIIYDWCLADGIHWKFIPPRSPHFGGIWESGVKIIKTHMKKIIGSRVLTLEFLYTLVVQIEGIMNSRPLSEMSADPNDLQPLTPGHFLIGTAINAIPEPNKCELPSNRLTQWQQLTQLLQLYWKRFYNEYVNTLQQRNKWIQSRDNVQINELVLIKDDNLPSTHWLMGRVINTIEGKDGKVRCLQLRTKNGVIKRAITNVAPLPDGRINK